MPQTYLLTWNPKNYTKGGDGDVDYSLGLKPGAIERWSCHSKQPKIGDTVYLIRLGVEPRGIVAKGTVAKESYEAEDWADKSKKRDYIEFKVEEYRPTCAAGLLPYLLLNTALPEQKWSPQAAGIEIISSVSTQLDTLWQRGIDRHSLRQLVDWMRDEPAYQRNDWFSKYTQTVSLVDKARNNRNLFTDELNHRVWRMEANGVAALGQGVLSNVDYDNNKEVLKKFFWRIIDNPSHATGEALRTEWEAMKKAGNFRQVYHSVIQRVFAAVAPEQYTSIANNDKCKKLLTILSEQFQLKNNTDGDWYLSNTEIMRCQREAGLDASHQIQNNIVMWLIYAIVNEGYKPNEQPESKYKIDQNVLRSYQEAFLRQFPGCQKFDTETYLAHERSYKEEIREIFNKTCANGLLNIPVDKPRLEALSEALIGLFTVKLASMDNKPQNLVGWRYFDFCRALDKNQKIEYLHTVAALLHGDKELPDRIDSFVAELEKYTAATGEKPGAAQIRSLTSFYLFLLDPKQYMFIKTNEISTAIKELSGEKIIGEKNELLRTFEFLAGVKFALEQDGWKPRDLIDVQSFIWVAKYYEGTQDDSEPTSITVPHISKDDFIKALKTPGVLRDRDMELLQTWRDMPNSEATSTQLTNALGHAKFIVTNGIIGRLSRRINDALQLNYKSDDDENKYWLELVTDFRRQTGSDLILIMKKELIMALDELAGKPIKSTAATNLILFGPPGTGKTWELNSLKAKYTTKSQAISREQWLAEQLRDQRWFDVVFMALYTLGGKASVSDIYQHEYIIQKARIANRHKNVRQTIWGTLQEHASASSKTVNTSKRFGPLVFDKNEESVWSLVGSWGDECYEQVQLAEKLKNSQSESIEVRRYDFVTFHQAYSYEDFVEGIRPEQDEESGELVYRIKPGVFKRITERAKNDPANRYAIFIDEINRGNIARIFGELITLIEIDKRAVYSAEGKITNDGMELTLPYSGDAFGVPANLDIYGTMNTADRSIALLDTALRRRFRFRELMPDASVIKGTNGEGMIDDGQGGKINLCALLDAMNRRIRFLLHRDQMLGHAYLCKVRSFAELKDVLLNQLVPLLQEYFYSDWHRIQLVFRDIGEGDTAIKPQIIIHEKLSEEVVLGFDHNDFEDLVEYRVARPEDITPEAIRKIYE